MKENKKALLKQLFGGFLGGITGLIVFVLVLSFIPSIQDANIFRIFGYQPIKEILKETTKEIIIKDTDVWKDVFERNKSSIVLVQLFKGKALIFQNSGVVMTDDGIIISPLSKNLVNSADQIQIFSEQGFFTAKGLLSDDNNLSLLQISQPGFKSVQFSPETNIPIAQMGLILGSDLKINQISYFAQQGLVKSKDSVVYFLDTASKDRVIGSGIFDTSGKLFGLVNVNRSGQVFAYNTQILQNLLDRYISSK